MLWWSINFKVKITIYPYGLNERSKFINKDSPKRKLFPTLRKNGQRFINTRARSKITSYDLSSDMEIIFSFLKQFPLK